MAQRMSRPYCKVDAGIDSAKDRAIAKAVKLVAPVNKLTIFGCGDSDCGRHLPLKGYGGPTRGLQRALSSCPRVIFLWIWEFRTTVVCHRCWRRLSKMIAEGTKVGKDGSRTLDIKEVYKILECTHIDGENNDDRCGFSGDRDVNAAINILMLLICLINKEDRPALFTRLVRKFT